MTLKEYWEQYAAPYTPDPAAAGAYLEMIRPSEPDWHPPYWGTDDWAIWCTNWINTYVYTMYGDRELFDYLIKDTFIQTITAVHNATYYMALNNQYKYKHLYDLFEAEFEPLWNVDGTTKTTFDWDMNRTGKDELTRSGEDKNVRSGNQANAVTGTDTTTNSTTTYDSSSDHTTDKSALLHGRTDTLTFNSVTDTRTYTALKDSREYTNLKDKKSGTETVERTGNIGVTKATELAADALDWAGRFKLPEIIACDIVGAISYPFV